MNKLKIVSVILGLITIPISLYITYWILSQLNPDRLVWFLFIINVPLIIIVSIIQKFVEDEE